GKIRRPWGTSPMPRCAISWLGSRVMSSPENRIRPRRGRANPMIERMSVVLPMPFRPRSATAVPGRTSRETTWRTWESPYYVWRSSPLSTPSSRRSPPPVPGPRAEVDFLDRRVRADGLFGSLRHQAPEMQHRHGLGHLEGDVHIVLDHEDREPGSQPLDEPGHLPALPRGEAGGGLVEEEHPRGPGEGEQDLQLPLLAVRQD